MADRLLVDVDSERRVTVSAWWDGELPAVGETTEFDWPLDGTALESLRWYLEDYLRAPYGPYAGQGLAIEGNLKKWGELVFGSLLGGGNALVAYRALRARSGPAEIVIRSALPEVLSLPWEILRDPSRPTPVALDGVGVTRSVPDSSLGEAFAVNGERLRVLMVISRPLGAKDVGYRMIARPLLSRLAAVDGQIELVVLRPPTLQELRRTLVEARAEGRPFQVVHFDGHGTLSGNVTDGEPVVFLGPGPHGLLSFEDADGASDEVPAGKVASALKEGEVPLVVLNACQSGAVGKELEAAVATRLLQEGVGSVVAMAYTVYATAAATFMASFYERLFAGATVTDAVGAGRRSLHENDRRSSPMGELTLADWIVPVHYRRRDVHFPHLKAEQNRTALPIAATSEAETDPAAPLQPEEEFVGRDGLFYELERAVRLQRTVLLFGPGGTGKTELAKAFGRWLRDTGGVDGHDAVVFHSFEPGAASFGLDGVVNGIGLQLFGVEFSLAPPEERLARVEQELAARRLLLIWDNFESVYSMPDPSRATPPLGEDERMSLKEFLGRIPNGRSSVIVTSRSQEAWLGIAPMAVGGLVGHEVTAYADQTLGPHPGAASRRKTKAFAELLAWLDGHPLSMRIVLPHLATIDAEELLEGLQGTGRLPDASVEVEGHNASLARSIDYSFRHLEPEAQRLLVALSLFHGVADPAILAALSRVSELPQRFVGVEDEVWWRVLEQAADVGLLTRLELRMYQIHPALPAVLAALWKSDDPNGFDRERAQAANALMLAYAGFALGVSEMEAIDTVAAGLVMVARHRRALGHMLQVALEAEHWEVAYALSKPLLHYLDLRGESEEAQIWADRALSRIEGHDSTPPKVDTAAGDFWLALVASQANRAIYAYQLDVAERIYRRILAMIEMQTDSPRRQYVLSVVLYQLGIIEQHRGAFDAAEEWYRQSLTIRRERGEPDALASIAHQFGNLEQARGDFDRAEEWYREALEMSEQTQHGEQMAATYHQLGMVSQGREDYNRAEQWYRKSLAIEQQLGSQRGLASSYHQLGVVASLRGRLDEAESLYLESLAIEEALRNRSGMASSYAQLGDLAVRRGQLDQAARWFRSGLELTEALGDSLHVALMCNGMAVVVQRIDGDAAALQWLIRSLDTYQEPRHPMVRQTATNLAIIVEKVGLDEVESAWLDATGGSMPEWVSRLMREDRDGDEHR